MSRIARCFVSSGILFGMINIFLPDSKGNGIKPGTVHRPARKRFRRGGVG